MLKTTPEQMKQAVAESGWIDGEVVAIGQLRQGKAPSTLGLVTGAALVEILRPRRCKRVPRHFVLVVTADRVVAFKASGGSGEGSSQYTVRIRPGEQASFPRATVSMSDLTDGPRSKGGTMAIDGESFPVSRPNLSGDPNTDELLGLLST